MNRQDIDAFDDSDFALLSTLSNSLAVHSNPWILACPVKSFCSLFNRGPLACRSET